MAKKPPAKATKRKAKAKPPAKVGRPSTYAPALAATICQRIANGETLSVICRDEGMPDRVTVFRWERAHDEFRNDLARAREAQALRWAEQILEIADDGTNDFVATEKGPAFNAEHVQRSRLRVDTRKWLLAKALPRLYGDKVDGDLGSATNPIVVLLQQMQARALPVVPMVEGKVTEVDDEQ